MATRTQTQTEATGGFGRCVLVQWSGLLNGDDGDKADLAGFSDKTVQITGTPGTGGTIILEGTLDGTTYAQLTDPQGNPISFTAAGIEAVSENVIGLRPRVTAGDGSTNFVCNVLAKRGS